MGAMVSALLGIPVVALGTPAAFVLLVVLSWVAP